MFTIPHVEMRVWKPLLAMLFFIAALLYFTGIWKFRLQQDNFQDIDVQKMITELQQATGALGKQNAYSSWVGWLYTHVESSGAPLNDFKNRFFYPNCKFRRDWATRLPQGLTRPIPAANKNLANISYRTFISCVAEGNQECIQQLQDAHLRFMEPTCQFSRQSSSEITKNIQEVFV